jgi:hypothetical protein
MRWLMRMALLAQLFSSSSSSPLSFYKGHQDHSTVSKRDEEFTVENLSNEFKGIYWNHIFSEKDDCTVEQRNQIIYATRATMWLLEPLVDDMEYAYSTAWNTHIQPHGHVTLVTITIGKGEAKKSRKLRVLFSVSMAIIRISHLLTTITVNIMQTAKYPRQGHQKRTSPESKLHYTCDLTNQGSVAEKCARGVTYVFRTSGTGYLILCFDVLTVSQRCDHHRGERKQM